MNQIMTPGLTGIAMLLLYAKWVKHRAQNKISANMNKDFEKKHLNLIQIALNSNKKTSDLHYAICSSYGFNKGYFSTKLSGFPSPGARVCWLKFHSKSSLFHLHTYTVPISSKGLRNQGELRKKPSYFPLYWLAYRDPYIGL